jgi:hypothetical protein
MTKADSVHSTPRKTASKINPPVDPTRRNLLTVAAGGAVAAAMSPALLSAAAADPIFAAIEAHRKTHIAHMASLAVQARFERRYGIGEGSWVSAKPCEDEFDAFAAFVAESATTVQGLFAKLAYFDELAGDFETEWMVNDRAEAAVLIQSFGASLKNIGVRP